MMDLTTLYRFFNGGELLYVGITNCVPRRMDEHGESKPWFMNATRITLEHFASRGDAEAAELAAIITEKPRYNVRHTGRVPTSATNGRPWVKAAKPLGPWVFHSLRTGCMRTEPELWLEFQLDGQSVLGDYDDLDGEEQFRIYAGYLRRSYPEWIQRDVVPIYWSVLPVHETAPFMSVAGWKAVGSATAEHGLGSESFLSYFSWPEDAKTGEPLDWFTLPVRATCFPEFAEFLGWVPSALQPYCPLRSIIASKNRQLLG